MGQIITYISVKEYARLHFMSERDVTRKIREAKIKAKKLKGQWAIYV